LSGSSNLWIEHTNGGRFSCGKAPLDAFLHTLVSQYEKRGLGKTFVAIQPGQKRVYGYYTLASAAVPFERVPEKAAGKLPKHPVPVVLLARLAVEESMQGKGLGGLLLADALKRSLDLSKKLGIHAVAVEAIDQQAESFYEKFGFVALRDNPLHLYLPIATIGREFAKDEQAGE
jgi:GNAT superfamily N-acetyltransferase